MVSKNDILHAIRRIADQNGGKPPGSQRFRTETGIRGSEWRGRYWARWGDALREAGYVPNEWTPAFADDYLLDQLAALAKEIGRFPVIAELAMKRQSDRNFPSEPSFRRLGSKSEMARKLAEFCEVKNGYEDVVEMCRAVFGTAVAPTELSVSQGPPALGFVYLMKSGKHYKIGKSNSVGRREYELGIQLPEKLIVIHKISTDDPSGIEEYWHKRFACSRRNGEWFELTAQQVSDFKRRKFM